MDIVHFFLAPTGGQSKFHLDTNQTHSVGCRDSRISVLLGGTTRLMDTRLWGIERVQNVHLEHTLGVMEQWNVQNAQLVRTRAVLEQLI